MIAEITSATGIDPITIEELLRTDPRLIATIIDIIRKRTEKQKKGRHGRR